MCDKTGCSVTKGFETGWLITRLPPIVFRWRLGFRLARVTNAELRSSCAHPVPPPASLTGQAQARRRAPFSCQALPQEFDFIYAVEETMAGLPQQVEVFAGIIL